MKLEWYVLNESLNRKTVEPFNIFNNISLYKRTIELCKSYEKGELNFEEFADSLRSAIMWQEWSRREYEIMVAPLWDDTKWQKIDCYAQVLPNIKILAKYVLDTYKEVENYDI